MNPDLMISILWIFVGVFIAVPFYLLPSLIAWGFGKESKRNLKAILALNILLGWTFIGWVISLVWALKKDD